MSPLYLPVLIAINDQSGVSHALESAAAKTREGDHGQAHVSGCFRGRQDVGRGAAG